MPRALVLTAVTGSLVGKRYSFINRVCTIGSSSSCDMVLFDRMVGTRHAELRQVLERWFVAPVVTGAQIYVNSQPVTSQARLNEGDVVTFGTVSFAVSFSEMQEQSVGESGNSSLPRLGDYLVRRGIVSREQMSRALQRQSELSRQGRRMQIGDVLQEMGLVTRHQLDQAAAEQRTDFSERFRD